VPFDSSFAELLTLPGRPTIMRVRIGGRIFFSGRYVDPHGITGYMFSRAVPVANFAQTAE